VIVVDTDNRGRRHDRVWWALASAFDPKRSCADHRPRPLDAARSGPADRARDITSRIILDACTPSSGRTSRTRSIMDRDMLQRVSDRWNEYGFTGPSPVSEMIGRLTRPQVKKK